MSTETLEQKATITNEGQPSYLIEYDQTPLEKATRVRIEFNLDTIADNVDWGTKFLRGALEELKAELLMVTGAKRKLKAATGGKVILPAGIKVH